MKGTFVALLRGINVGGRNRLAMAELKSMFQDAGCRSARTYIQSGNVVFRSTREEARRICDAVRAALAARLGTDIPIILRSGANLARIAGDNPFPAAEEDPRLLHVGFLSDRPASDRISALDPNRSPPDEFAVRGREVYLYLPNGAARTKLTAAYFDRTLGIAATFRNWRTVKTLQRICGL